MSTRTLLFQLADSAFPSGAFAHSLGFEALRQLGLLEGEDAVRARLVELTWHLARGALPFLNDAHGGRAALADAACDAFLTNHVAHRASRAQGRALAMAMEATFGPSPNPPAHVAVVAGAEFARAGLSLDDAREVFLFAAVRSALSAAVRLGAVGPLRAQALLASLHEELARALADTRGLGSHDAESVSVAIETAQASHDQLYSRLFQS